jgi:hypothetical protein
VCVRVLHCAQVPSDFDVDIEFLFDFALQGCL